MTEDRIERLAREVAADVSRSFQGFSLDYIESFEQGFTITYHWAGQGNDYSYIAVTISPIQHETDESIREEIRRQLRLA